MNEKTKKVCRWFSYALAIAGAALMLRDASVTTVIGVCFLLWSNNLAESLKSEPKSQV
jgi:hypothetical protein